MSGRYRVVRVITRLNIGGPAIHAVLLTAHLDQTRYESFLVTGVEGDTEGSMRSLAEQHGVTPIVIPELGREISPVDDLAAIARLYRLFRRLRPHIVHTHTAKAGTVGRMAAVLARVPVRLHTFHGHVFHSYFGRAKTRLFLQLETALARGTDRIVTVGEQQRQEIATFGVAPVSKITSVPLGLELSPFFEAKQRRGELRVELGLPDEAPLIGIVARLVPVKAHEYFLQAAAAVAERRPDVRFLIVGDGERRQELEAMATALEIRDRTLFLGWRSDLPRIYADLDVVVLSSLNEGSPVALIEALAAGRPVVSADVGGVSEIVRNRETGLLVPPRDSAGLAQGILQLLDDPACYGATGRALVKDRYTRERLVKDVESMYEQLLSEKGVRP